MRDDRQLPSAAMPDLFDRRMAAIHELPDVIQTKPSTVRSVPPFGIGGTQVFIVQTFRQREEGDTVFLEVVGGDGAVRVALPPSVSDAIARQRSSLTGQSRSRASAVTAADRKKRGIEPAFVRRKRRKGGTR